MSRREPGLVGAGSGLRAAREARGLSLRRLASQLDVSAATLSGIETGRTRVTRERLAHIATLLGSSVSQLLPADAERAELQAEPVVSTAPHWRAYAPLDFDPPLRAALDAFLEFGYHGASTREIARRAGLSVPGLYHHYPTKQHMLVAIIDYVMEDLIRRSLEARADGETPAERFALIVESLTLFHGVRLDLGFVGSSELRSLEPGALQRNRHLRRRHKQMMDGETDAAVAAGEFHCDDPRAAVRAVVSLCVALPLWYRPDGPATPRQVARQYVDYALQLVGYRKSREALLRRLKIGTEPD